MVEPGRDENIFVPAQDTMLPVDASYTVEYAGDGVFLKVAHNRQAVCRSLPVSSRLT